MARPWKPSPEDFDKCNRRARRDAIFAGATGGLFSAILGERAFKFDRKTTLASGLAAGALSTYFFSQAFLSSYLAQLEHETKRRAVLAQKDDPDTFFSGFDNTSGRSADSGS